jgi:hypothetical protein
LAILIALQPETSLITAKIGGDLSEKRKGKYSKTILKQGSFILLRGDAAHAGTKYTKLNYRLHLEIKTAAYIFNDEKGFDQFGIFTRRERKQSDLPTSIPVKHSTNNKKGNAEEMSAATSRLEDVGNCGLLILRWSCPRSPTTWSKCVLMDCTSDPLVLIEGCHHVIF